MYDTKFCCSNTFVLLLYEGRHLIVLFHSINFSGACCNHYDALYPVNSVHSPVNSNMVVSRNVYD